MHTQIDWSDQSAPFSMQFDGLYFNSQHALEAARYTFIEGNRLMERWSEWQPNSSTLCTRPNGQHSWRQHSWRQPHRSFHVE